MDPVDVIMEARQIAENLEKPGRVFAPVPQLDEMARLARCVEELAKRVDVHDDTLYGESGG